MNKPMLLLIAMTVSCCWGGTVERAEPDGITLHCGELDGTNYCQTTDYPHFQRSPQWDQEKDECPLSAKDAIAAARFSLRGQFPRAAGWNVADINLSSLGNSGTWYYTIWLRPSGASTITNRGVRIMVTLNGMVPPLLPDDMELREVYQGKGVWQGERRPRSRCLEDKESDPKTTNNVCGTQEIR